MRKRLKFKPKAVIFDMDGVIIDSMPYHFIAWYESLRSLGVRVSCLDIYKNEGERWDKTLKGLLAGSGINPAPGVLKKIFFNRQKIFKKYFRRFIFKGTRECLECLRKKGYLLGMVTGTPGVEVKRILPESLRKIFHCVVTGEQVKQGKPHPEPYLRAANILNVRPKECVVVENAPLGIESAKKAGMFCVALSTGLPPEYLKGADMVLGELNELGLVIERVCVL
ncbi:MAG: HAD family phosphatase [Candidatus Omnitrophica bacterium]|nr:HAD family phosphatase [Candidatus Omnitrophota bacterium]MDD5553693.1 HAD family phosphatase [Candidatus Omnitrophota bacterium]